LGELPSTAKTRLQRLLHGWSANLVQVLLGIVQQLVLIPIFLHVWTANVLAAWLVAYAAGSLVVVADAGLQLRAVNRFLAFKSCVDYDGRTANFYTRMLRIYLSVIAVLGIVLIGGTQLWSPSAVLGFRASSDFNSAVVVMMLGMLVTIPANLASGLYRVRGRYGRAVWLQNAALVLGQVAQVIAVVFFGSLVAVAIAFVSAQIVFAVFLLLFDAPRFFPFLKTGAARRRPSWRWMTGQLGLASPFMASNVTELALVNLPVLLVSSLVVDRIAVAQWGLTRIIATLLRGLCVQMSMPLAAELGQDFAIGDKERLRRLYARGSAFVTIIASLIVGGLLPFWQDFFRLWTHGTVPYDGPLAITLLFGAAVTAPSLLALVFAYHSNRGSLLARARLLQLAVFLTLSFLLIPKLGPLGAGLAIVTSDLAVQFGLLTVVIIRQTLKSPLQHVVFLAVMAAAIVSAGWGIGIAVAFVVGGSGLLHIIVECTIWLVVVGVLASPLAGRHIRERLIAVIPI
jgi:O-antigen/teichoic acid export membrane protein